MPVMKLLTSEHFANIVTKILRNNPIQLLRSKKPLVNLGCGGRILPDFYNIDYTWKLGLDLCWDLRRRWPLKDDSIDGIFFEHALEHFEWQDAVNTVLPEAHRVLRAGGVIRISVPDAEKAVDAYVRARDEGLTRWDKPAHHEPNRLHLTPMGVLNNTFRRIYEPYYMGHKFGYDYQTLEHFLHLSGFRDIRRADFNTGRDSRLLVDYAKRRDESLYVEASK